MVGKRSTKHTSSDDSESSAGDVTIAITNSSPWNTPPRGSPTNSHLLSEPPSPNVASSDHDDRLEKRDLAALTIASCVGICIKSIHHHQLRNSAETIATGTESNISWGLVLSLVAYTLFACWLDTSTIHRTDPIAVTGWILILVVVVIPPNPSTILVFDTTYMVYSLVVNSPVLADAHLSFHDRLQYMASGQAVNLCATLSINYIVPILWVPPKVLLIVASVVLLRAQAMMASQQQQQNQPWLVLIPYHRRRRRRRSHTPSLVSSSSTCLALAVEAPHGSAVWIWWAIELLLEAQLHVYRPSIPSSLPRLQASTLVVFLLFYACQSYRPVYAAMFGLGALAALTTDQQHHQWMGWPLCAVQWAGYQFVLADVLRSNTSNNSHPPAARLVGRTKLVCRLAAVMLRGVVHAEHNLTLGCAFALQLVLWRQYTVSVTAPRRLRFEDTTKANAVETSIIL